ncbi:MAG: hypothetical protein J0I47_07635 [Sphingomonas sp.]|uniref:hypothetical protein n=1 Tax=Sphingomonas sp. TaxID=28214 RepID=UPI001AD5760B|nr:hypothetical protein [Sphingomonas sp.]MBN8808094.1 hypothetical protein [Sphingomonas sp.]
MRLPAMLACAGLMLAGCHSPTSATSSESDLDLARTCWPVASAKALQNKDFGIADMGEIVAYASIVAKAQPGSALITDKIGKVMGTPLSDADKKRLSTNLDTYQTQCRARFPVAAGTAAPTLPSDPVDRTLWCLMAATFLDKAMQGAGKSDYPQKAQVGRVLRTAIASLDKRAAAAKGIASQADFNAYRDRQADALFANRLDRVVAACPAQ